MDPIIDRDPGPEPDPDPDPEPEPFPIYIPIPNEGGSLPTTPSPKIPVGKVTRLSNEIKRQKIHALYQELGVTGDVNLVDLDRFRLNRN